ncbi:YfhO family protein [Magnetospirillum moscoviense]|nr:YfhO family protein [Magnetospirillum moscoviense]
MFPTLPTTSYGLTLATVALAALALTVAGLLSRPPAEPSRHGARVLMIGWTALASLEFWILGPASYLATYADLDFTPLVQTYLVDRHPGGQFAHAFAGGNDVAALGLFTGQYVALDRLLLSVLPLWATSAILRIAQEGVALVGMYLLARRSLGADRLLALAVAAVYTLSNQYFVKLTWVHGLGFALIPLLIHLAVGRSARRNYWPPLIGIGLLHTISSTPTHSGMAAVGALALSLAMVPRCRPLKSMMGIAALGGLLVLNWHESLWAKAQLSPYAFRSAETVLTLAPVDTVVHALIQITDLADHRIACLWLGLAALWLARSPQWKRMAVVLLVSAVGGLVIQNLPWAAMGKLKPLASLNWDRVRLSLDILALMAVCLGTGALAAAGQRRARHAVFAAVGGLAVANLVWCKAYNLSTWVSLGGLANDVAGLENVAAIRLPTTEPVRVVTVPYRLPNNLAAAAGLSSFDGMFNLNLTNYSYFWLHAVLKHPGDAESSYITLETAALDMKCCASIDLTGHADLAMLRLVNVGYVLSALPLTGADVRQVWGPPPDQDLPSRRTDPVGQRVLGYLREMVSAPAIRVYAIGSPAPRLYPARYAVASSDNDRHPGFYELVRRHGPDGGIVAAEDTLASLRPTNSLSVVGFDLVTDGIDARVDAPDGGVVVVSIPFSPYWSAKIDGNPVVLQPVNGAQMAMAIPAGTRAVELRYHRPRLREKLGLR